MSTESISSRVALGLGANLGQPQETFQQACAALSAGGVSNLRMASCYQTEPVGCHPGIPLFTNSAVTGLWQGSPQQLLTLTQRIEVQLGRPRQHDSQGSRQIDIDLLLFADLCLNAPELCIPHPRLCQRLFVLKPLAEIAPDWTIPPTRKKVAEILLEIGRKE